MDPKNKTYARILAYVAMLPPGEQTETIIALIGNTLKKMPLGEILEIRDAITARFDETTPLVNVALELIEGQLALREIAGGLPWR